MIPSFFKAQGQRLSTAPHQHRDSHQQFPRHQHSHQQQQQPVLHHPRPQYAQHQQHQQQQHQQQHHSHGIPLHQHQQHSSSHPRGLSPRPPPHGHQHNHQRQQGGAFSGSHDNVYSGAAVTSHSAAQVSGRPTAASAAAAHISNHAVFNGSGGPTPGYGGADMDASMIVHADNSATATTTADFYASMPSLPHRYQMQQPQSQPQLQQQQQQHQHQQHQQPSKGEKPFKDVEYLSGAEGWYAKRQLAVNNSSNGNGNGNGSSNSHPMLYSSSLSRMDSTVMREDILRDYFDGPVQQVPLNGGDDFDIDNPFPEDDGQVNGNDNVGGHGDGNFGGHGNGRPMVNASMPVMMQTSSSTLNRQHRPQPLQHPSAATTSSTLPRSAGHSNHRHMRSISPSASTIAPPPDVHYQRLRMSKASDPNLANGSNPHNLSSPVQLKTKSPPPPSTRSLSPPPVIRPRTSSASHLNLSSPGSSPRLHQAQPSTSATSPRTSNIPLQPSTQSNPVTIDSAPLSPIDITNIDIASEIARRVDKQLQPLKLMLAERDVTLQRCNESITNNEQDIQQQTTIKAKTSENVTEQLAKLRQIYAKRNAELESKKQACEAKKKELDQLEGDSISNNNNNNNRDSNNSNTSAPSRISIALQLAEQVEQKSANLQAEHGALKKQLERLKAKRVAQLAERQSKFGCDSVLYGDEADRASWLAVKDTAAHAQSEIARALDDVVNGMAMMNAQMETIQRAHDAFQKVAHLATSRVDTAAD
ncbi:hypothetical protein GQ42DRAFT_162389 [Ramicandelaber brevisporus]|nr:hypothetical protein GQ42DRAFT_162389 [Ramicandelaber brevisporus]